MANPPPYVVSYSFTGYQNSNPFDPLPAPQIDNEYANIALSLNAAISGLNQIRRSDGKLQNGIVSIDSVDSSFIDDISTGISGDVAAAEAAAAAAQASADAANASELQASSFATSAWNAETNAEALVQAAEAGFVGFTNIAYDLGSITDTVTYFDQDWGTVP